PRPPPRQPMPRHARQITWAEETVQLKDYGATRMRRRRRRGANGGKPRGTPGRLSRVQRPLVSSLALPLSQVRPR
ncbi:MAG: hypothetical protein WB773_28325, partial [Isosphaeraceae bacterium]